MKNNKIIISILAIIVVGIIAIFYLTKEDPVKKQIEEVKKESTKDT
jgi:hypothetical protein